MLKAKSMLFVAICLFLSCNAQNKERPFIWTSAEEHAVILKKIENRPWAKASFEDIKRNVDEQVALHQKSKEAFLRGMPLDWSEEVKGAIPALTYTTTGKKGKHENLDNAREDEMVNFNKLSAYLKTAVDAGFLYYLTANDDYAKCATDILYTAVTGITQLKPSQWKPRGGWLCPDDILRESRLIGEKFPIIYDFVAPYLKKGGKPYDFAAKTEVSFPFEKAQEVFRTYAKLVVEHGMINSNHPVLEANCLVYNALALDDRAERNTYLSYYLTNSTSNQDALAKVAGFYKNEGDIWPESSQYTNDVAKRSTELMYLLTKYDPSLQLGRKYPNIPWALQRLDYLVYPNGELVLWGDGHRKYKTPYHAYEMAYKLGKFDSIPKLKERFSTLLGSALATGKHQRRGLEALLWYHDDFEKVEASISLPRTDEQPHAGIFLQRNTSVTQNIEDGLMCFVGGASMVHGHASGMNIELYGEGVVLGVDNGRGKYAQDIHENYSRIFAAHNTVIVNGASQGEGQWVNLGMDTVSLEFMEPMPKQTALSSNHSFSTTNFFDGGGTKSEASQKRTLALVRTSPTTGYYLDVFRSKSELPNEYHDYLYHNLGESLEFLTNSITLSKDPERYMANADDTWIRNRKYRNPGWHFFKDVWSSETYDKDIALLFKAEGFEDKKRYMKMFMPGFEGRTYTKAMAPKTFEAPKPYDLLPTPTLVVRQNGEAYTKPFVAVYEPFANTATEASVKSVEKLTSQNLFQGVKVISMVGNETLVQYILTPFGNKAISLGEHNMVFKGHFAIITFADDNILKDVYIGHGSRLQVASYTMESDGKPVNAYIDFSSQIPKVKGGFKLKAKD